MYFLCIGIILLLTLSVLYLHIFKEVSIIVCKVLSIYGKIVVNSVEKHTLISENYVYKVLYMCKKNFTGHTYVSFKRYLILYVNYEVLCMMGKILPCHLVNEHSCICGK